MSCDCDLFDKAFDKSFLFRKVVIIKESVKIFNKFPYYFGISQFNLPL
jgi:hypothetical protein